MTRATLSSAENPLRIAKLPVGPGTIGVTFLPGKQQPDGMTARHKRDLGADLDVIAAWNAACVVTLVEAHELERFGVADLGEQVRVRHMEWHHWPIADFQAPDRAFDAAWPARSAMLRGLLARGGRVLVHCKGGLGRAGTIAARLLVDGGMTSGAAIAAVRAARSPQAIEVEAQERWLSAARPVPLPRPDPNAARDRAMGALLGLAVGDAVGAAIEFSAKPRWAVLDDMRGGGPFSLQRGQWTDDTAMALALADSLLHDPALDAPDLMRRFLSWYDEGIYSCTGVCFDIGNATQAALDRFRRGGDALAGSADPSSAGNGALMRLAPVAVRHWRDRDALAQVAALQTQTTHAAPKTLHASDVFATLLADAIAGLPLHEVLDSLAAARIEGGWRGLHRDAVRGDGYVVRSLQAAVWAVSRTTSFRSAVLLAANLGEDADTTAAIAGQLAGAIYGASGIPAEWLDALAWQDRLKETAAKLFGAGLAESAPSAFDAEAPWEQGRPSTRDRLTALAGFAPIFANADFSPVTDDPVAEPGIYYGVTYTKDVERFTQMTYDMGWVRIIAWFEWRDTPRGRALMKNPAAMADATVEELACVLTTCIRADRFCDGYLADAFAAGLVRQVVLRAEKLLEAKA